MRNKTFISSMVGIAAAVAVAGSANAGVVDPFTTDQTAVGTTLASPAPFISITGGLFNQRQLARVGTGSGSIGSTFANFVPKGIFMVYQQAGGSTIDLSSIASMSFDLTRGAASFNIGWNFYDATGLQSTLELTAPSAGTITTSATDPARVTDAGFNWGSITQMEMQFIGGFSSSTAGLSNFNYTAVPAPGALALLGVAGLAGGRRRRA